MQIGIIGAGEIGSALARHFVRAGHHVMIANSRGPETLTDVAADTGAMAVALTTAARANNIVVVTIPQRAVPRLPRDLFANSAPGLAVVDTGNYYPGVRDERIDEIEAGLPESAWVAQQLGHPVVKAFNNIGAGSLRELGKPPGSAGRIALPVAADQQPAKALVLGLIDAIGFDAVDAGPIAESWRQQPGTPAYSRDLELAGLKRALTEAEPSRIAEYRLLAAERVRRYLAEQAQRS